MTLLRFFNQHSAFLAALALVAALEALFGAASWPLVLALALLLSLGWWWARQRDSAASDARVCRLCLSCRVLLTGVPVVRASDRSPQASL